MNNKLEIQKFLRNGGTIDELKEKYAISTSTHHEYPNLISFKYNQIESPFNEQIVREARSLVLDSTDNWRCVCQGFTKFFNYGEGNAAEIDWSTAKMQEKVDGTLIVVYEYNGEWHTATTGTPDADGNVNGFDFTFSELFWKTVYEMDAVVPDPKQMSHICFFFELCTPWNKIVVNHKDSKLVSLGCRDRITGQEYSGYSTDIYWNIPPVKEFALKSFAQATESFTDINPFEQEGYVYVDAKFNRVKHKHPGYVAAHHIKSSFSLKNLVEMIRTNTVADFPVQFPEYAEIYDDVIAKYNLLIKQINDSYQQYAHIETQKDFALSIKDLKFSGALFALRGKKVETLEQYIAKINIKNLMNWLGLKYEENEENEEKEKNEE